MKQPKWQVETFKKSWNIIPMSLSRKGKSPTNQEINQKKDLSGNDHGIWWALNTRRKTKLNTSEIYVIEKECFRRFDSLKQKE